MVCTLGLPSASSFAVAGAPNIQVCATAFAGFDGSIVLVAFFLLLHVLLVC